MTVTASEKAHMLRCASPVVVAAYAKVRLTPPESRALPLELFAKPLQMYLISDIIAGKLK
ncbi:MAG: hypothetical protein A2X92_01780 [Syntrophus sp. GWC2_56_31]|nr:MAG: hypothetical protein A2X92_01780 [Syntrophus sp. GWC2_56_31]